MPKLTNTDILKANIITALEKSLGVVTTACKSVDISRMTFYEWYNNDEAFKKKVDSIQDIALDYAESQLHKRIKEGSDTAIIFYLKTKGKNRGYVERQEIKSDVKVNGLQIITVNPDDKEQITKLLEGKNDNDD
jgi:pyruvate/2-oxoacid:ferredoxin oxidoreductase alpha subunit